MKTFAIAALVGIALLPGTCSAMSGHGRRAEEYRQGHPGAESAPGYVGGHYEGQKPIATPEPSTLLLMGLGVGGLALRHFAKKKKSRA